MAEDFPMSLRQLIPLLDVVGHANKHLGRISKFMRKYGDMNMFPVRVQVNLFWLGGKELFLGSTSSEYLSFGLFQKIQIFLKASWLVWFAKRIQSSQTRRRTFEFHTHWNFRINVWRFGISRRTSRHILREDSSRSRYFEEILIL